MSYFHLCEVKTYFDDVKKSVGIQKWIDETNQLIYLHLDIFCVFFQGIFVPLQRPIMEKVQRGSAMLREGGEE